MECGGFYKRIWKKLHKVKKGKVLNYGNVNLLWNFSGVIYWGMDDIKKVFFGRFMALEQDLFCKAKTREATKAK